MFTALVPQTTVPPDTTEVPTAMASVTSEVPIEDSETSIPLEITASGTAEPRTAPGSNDAFPVWPAIAVIAILVAIFLRARKKRQSK